MIISEYVIDGVNIMDRTKIYNEICNIKKRLDYDSNEYFIQDLLGDIIDEKVIYESNELSNINRSYIIESLLLGFTPKIAIRHYKGKIEVILGDDIVDTIEKFVNNEFRLNGMLFLCEMNGCNYNDIFNIIKCDVTVKSIKYYNVENDLSTDEIIKIKQLMKMGI
jgi:hypothetical protein